MSFVDKEEKRFVLPDRAGKLPYHVVCNRLRPRGSEVIASVQGRVLMPVLKKTVDLLRAAFADHVDLRGTSKFS